MIDSCSLFKNLSRNSILTFTFILIIDSIMKRITSFDPFINLKFKSLDKLLSFISLSIFLLSLLLLDLSFFMYDLQKGL